MRKIFLVLSIVVISIGWTSCTKEKAPVVLTKKQVQHQIDSIMAERSKELEAEGKKDLNSRLKIEVKVKADSIMQARLQPPPKVVAPKPVVNIPTHQKGLFK